MLEMVNFYFILTKSINQSIINEAAKIIHSVFYVVIVGNHVFLRVGV